MMRELPIGCKVVDIRRGNRGTNRDKIVYAKLLHPDGTVLISATLEYIVTQLNDATFIDPIEFDIKYNAEFN